MSESKRQAAEIRLTDKIGKRGYSKREFMKLASMMGAGSVGLRKAVRKAYGEEPDGVPLVVTTDVHGNPDRVRYIPKERKRRLDIYSRFNVQTLKEKYPEVNGLGIEYGKDSTDLKLKLLLENDSTKLRRTLPNRSNGVPFTYEKDPQTEVTPLANRTEDRYESISSNINCGVRVGDGVYNRGTITATGYTASGAGAVLVSGHQVAYRDNRYLYQPYDGPTRNNTDSSIGKVLEVERLTSGGMDIAIYKFESSTRTLDPRNTEVDNQTDITGAWTYQGVTDSIDPIANDGPIANFGGCKNKRFGCEAVRTRKGYNLQYQVDFYDDYSLDTGDSGGPFVDSDGKLLSHLSGKYESDTLEGGKKIAFGGSGQELFDAVDFSLYP